VHFFTIFWWFLTPYIFKMVGRIDKIGVSTFGNSVNIYANSQVNLEWSGSTLYLRYVGFPWNDPLNDPWVGIFIVFRVCFFPVSKLLHLYIFVGLYCLYFYAHAHSRVKRLLRFVMSVCSRVSARLQQDWFPRDIILGTYDNLSRKSVFG
jgi:hypothetical protein